MQVADARKDGGEYWQADVSKENDDCDHTSVESSNLKVELSFAEPAVFEHASNEAFLKDFEPRPSTSTYVGGSKSVVRDFEPRPNLSTYSDGHIKSTHDKSFTKDFEPRPSVTAYVDNQKQKGKKSYGDLESGTIY